MKITNKFNLPKPIVKAAENKYSPIPGRLSVTTLINPPQLEELKRRHWEELEEDASDMLWAIMGTAMHNLFESKAEQKEEKLEYQYDEETTVVGKSDLLSDDMILTDYKYTSYWAMISPKPEWEAQLNLYAWLYRKKDIVPLKLQIIAFLRDWSASEASYKTSYPKTQIVTLPIPMWDNTECDRYVAERVQMFKEAQKLEDEKLTECTDADRWAKDSLYLVTRNNKRPLYFSSNWAAGQYQKQFGGVILIRNGDIARCVKYCPVVEFCSQARKLGWGVEGTYKNEKLPPK